MKKTICLLLALLLLLPAASSAEQADEDEFAASPGFPTLTEEQFVVDDLPEGYLASCGQPGRVEKLRYFVTDENESVKSVMVYLPRGYDESNEDCNVLYLLHAASGSPKNYLDTGRATPFQNLLDHMIADGVLRPLIVVAATYYPTEGFTQFLPLAKQVEVTAAFPRELVDDIIPAVESK